MDDLKKLSSLGDNILVVVAHPDDEVADFGGLLIKMVNLKKFIHVHVCTNGCGGSKNNSIEKKKLSKIRKEEFESCMKFLNITSFSISQNREDMSFDYNDKILLAEITKLIRKYRPSLILTHNPTFELEKIGNTTIPIHQDHINVGHATFNCSYPIAGNTNFFPNQLNKYKVFSPMSILWAVREKGKENIKIGISKEINLKVDAMYKYTSQFNSTSKPITPELNKSFGVVKNSAYELYNLVTFAKW